MAMTEAGENYEAAPARTSATSPWAPGRMAWEGKATMKERIEAKLFHLQSRLAYREKGEKGKKGKGKWEKKGKTES